MKPPILLSVPHAGLRVPAEVEDLCLLSPEEIEADGDGGARDIYDLEQEVAAYVTTDIARAVVDMNRAGDDFRKDGVVKTHTCWDVRIYKRVLSNAEKQKLIATYHRPYHRRLGSSAAKARLGVDCHTMAAFGPPVGPDAGKERPPLCLSDAEGTCPKEWFDAFADCLKKAFEVPVSLNAPFTGGYIIRAHCAELPWVQLEMSRADFYPIDQKRLRFLKALNLFNETGLLGN